MREGRQALKVVVGQFRSRVATGFPQFPSADVKTAGQRTLVQTQDTCETKKKVQPGVVMWS